MLARNLVCANSPLSHGICAGTDVKKLLYTPSIFPIVVPKRQLGPQLVSVIRHARHMGTIPNPRRDRVRAFVALGSNIGDRLGTIQEACRRIDTNVDMQVVRTSGLWETKAMYVLDQSDFLNGVCEVSAYLPGQTTQHD